MWRGLCGANLILVSHSDRSLPLSLAVWLCSFGYAQAFHTTSVGGSSDVARCTHVSLHLENKKPADLCVKSPRENISQASSHR